MNYEQVYFKIGSGALILFKNGEKVIYNGEYKKERLIIFLDENIHIREFSKLTQ